MNGVPEPTEQQISPFICRICRAPASMFVHGEGTVEYVHSRVWEDYNHDCDPAPAAKGEGDLACDFCGARDITWQYVLGAEMFMDIEDLTHGFSREWAVCGDCDQVIRRRNADALVARHFGSETTRRNSARRQRIQGCPDTPEQTRGGRKVIEEMVSRFLGMISERRPFTRPAPVTPITPRRLHRARQQLVRFWGSDMLREGLLDDPGVVVLPGEDAGCSALGLPVVRPTREMVDKFTQRIQQATATADLYWVSRDFTNLAVRSGKKLPDLTLLRDEVPTPSGLVVFATPVGEVSVDGDEPARALVIAASWTLIPGGVWVILHCQPEQVWPDQDRDELREFPGLLYPVAAGGAVPFGVTLPAEITQHASAGVWGTLLALWFLMRQPGVAATRDETPDRKDARRFARANNGQAMPAVRVVDLRRTGGTTGRGSGTGAARVVTKRSLVGGATGGFWRNQVHGPGRAERKRIWIDPFVRGPDGAPFADETPTVRVVR